MPWSSWCNRRGTGEAGAAGVRIVDGPPAAGRSRRPFSGGGGPPRATIWARTPPTNGGPP
ncbi:hypothetical protein HMPREF1550_00247 [Actinomyces sp. oral taxon 877 str. F0543]|nr:hypothetical protein HMPREF1550_00247 [Actinomyces sp. oral taxon 877 str. F0543]